tara:strand:+ start:473 stop:658 length:186 start_codon:yes stop_codon:yes gene_type:complete
VDMNIDVKATFVLVSFDTGMNKVIVINNKRKKDVTTILVFKVTKIPTIKINEKVLKFSFIG